MDLFATYKDAVRAEKAGETDTAIALWKICLQGDPNDRFGAALRLAALQQAPAPERAPHAYISNLFDSHADAFEDRLVRRLKYAVPARLADVLDLVGDPPFERVVDLGCGTGLLGEAIAPLCSSLAGVDLSRKMLDMAWAKGVYDDLYLGDIVSYLNQADAECVDILTCADVLPYLGEVEGFLRGAARVLRPGGLLGFSTEMVPDEATSDQVWMLRRNRRYAHAPEALRAAVKQVGFHIELFGSMTVRLERRQPVPGNLMVARRL